MTNKHFGQRIAVLIDVQNLYHSAKNIYKAKVNFGEILKEAVANRNLIRAFAYVIKTKAGEEKLFFEALTKLGIEMRVKDLQEFHGGQKKGDWDVGLSVDAIRISTTLDVIVIVSGDGDFIPLVEYLKNQGKRVEIMAFEKSSSHNLIEIADEFTDLGENPKRFLLKK